MTPAQLTSWENRLDHALADARLDPDVLRLLFGEMAAALMCQQASLTMWRAVCTKLEKEKEQVRERAERIQRMAALRCVQLQPDLRALAKYEDQFAAMAPGRVTLPPEGVGALLRRET